MTVMWSNHLTVSLSGSMYHTFEWGGGGGALPCMSYSGLCGTKGYGFFLAFVVWILTIKIFCLKLGKACQV